MTTATILFCLLLSSLHARQLNSAQPEEVGMSTRRLEQVDKVVETAILAGQTPGAVVLVARKGKVVYRKAFGLRSRGPTAEPMTLDTIFDVASLTKVLATATATMVLLEEGKLSLSDPVSHYMPGFSQNDKQDITIQQLLTHYSGLRPDLDLDQPWAGYETALTLAANEKLTAPPGERFIYSDINYFVLGELVRIVSGKHLHEFSRERIFQPLGMTNTGFNPDPALIHQIAPTEMLDGELLRGRVHDPTARRMGGCAGHAGLFSTVDDTATFAQMILNQGSYGSSRVLSPLSILKMTSSQSPHGKKDWRGLGFDIRTRFSSSRGDLFPVGSFGHTGFTGTSIWIDPWTETFVIIFTNRLYPEGRGNVVALRKKVASVVAASIVDVPGLHEYIEHP